LATWRVESDETILNHGCGRAVVLGLVAPNHFAGGGVQSVKLMTAEASPDKDLAADNCRRRQRAISRNYQFPAFHFPILRGEVGGLGGFQRLGLALRSR